MSNRVLIVDDEVCMQVVLRHYLERAGWDVIVAGDGCQAVRMAAEERPRLIITDFLLPEIDGLEVVRQIRSGAATRAIPVIMITANYSRVTPQEALYAGAEVLLTKPLSFVQLGQEIRRLAPEHADSHSGPVG